MSYFLEDVDIKNVLVSNKVYSGGKNYENLICYLYDDYTLSPCIQYFLKQARM